MKFVVEGRRLKVLTKSVRLLARYAEHANIVTNSNGFVFQAVNDTKSSFVEVVFQKDFFCDSSLTDDEDPTFQCKVDVKSLQMVFRVLNLDRISEKCIIKMDTDIHKIKVVMRCKDHTHREYVIPFMENEELRCPLVSSRMSKPSLKSSAKFMAEVFGNFVHSTKEATLWMFDNNIRFKNFIERDAANYYEVPTTNFTYLATDFSSYNFLRPLSVTCNIKDIKSFIEFGCHQNQLINTYILGDSSPIELNFNCTSDSYSARLVIATFEFDSSQQPQAPPFNPSQRSNSHASQQSFTTLNYSMSSSNVANNNQTTVNNTTVAPDNNESVTFSLNTPGNAANDNLSENINEIIQNLPDFTEPTDDSDPISDYVVNLEGTQLKDFQKRYLFGLDSQEKTPVDPADLEILASESEEEI